MINQTIKVCITKLRLFNSAALAITGAIKGTSQIKLYNELVLEFLAFRHAFRKLCLFFKIKNPTHVKVGHTSEFLFGSY